MYRVTKSVSFCYGHRLMNYRGKCRHLHGHNARVEVICRGPLDGLGRVVDFSEIGRVLNGWVDEHWDHRTILAADDPLAPILEEQGEPVYLLDGPPTAERLAAALFGVAREAGLPVAGIRFWETETSYAVFGEA